MNSLKHILDRHEAILNSDENSFPKPERRYTRYAVSIFRGGIGKTTLAFNLAYELSRNASLLVADVCPQRNLSELLLGNNIPSGPTIYDALISYAAAGMERVPPGTLGIL